MKGTSDRGRVFVLVGQRTLLYREEIDMEHRKMQFIKVKGKPHVRVRCLILNGNVNWASQRGLLMLFVNLIPLQFQTF